MRELTAASVDAHRYITIIERCTFPGIKGLRIKFFTGEVTRRLPAAPSSATAQPGGMFWFRRERCFGS